MAERPTDPQALQLFQLIGAPLLAVVQAEAQAAQVSAQFIKSVGFAAPASGAPNLPVDRPETRKFTESLQDGGDLGDLKTAEFRVERRNADGTVQTQVVKVPVLSLYPIPLLQVKDAEFDFHIQVLGRVSFKNDKDLDDEGMPPAREFLARNRVELTGLLTSSNEATRGSRADIRVKVRMEQSDLPAGLMRLMSVMGESVSHMPAPAQKSGASGG